MILIERPPELLRGELQREVPRRMLERVLLEGPGGKVGLLFGSPGPADSVHVRRADEGLGLEDSLTEVRIALVPPVDPEPPRARRRAPS